MPTLQYLRLEGLGEALEKKTEDAGGEWVKPPAIDFIISNGVQSKI